MWRRVDFVWTDVSEERFASIFRVEKSASEEPAWADTDKASRTSDGIFAHNLETNGFLLSVRIYIKYDISIDLSIYL
jgi:hypothetical protein